MEYYSLTQLLLFFKRQQIIGFQGVNFCLAIIDDDRLSDSEKKSAILDLLRRMELFDKEYLDKRIQELEEKAGLVEKSEDPVWEFTEMDLLNVTQVFDCQILNGKIWFEWNLN